MARRYTDEDVAAWYARYEQGLTVREVAREVGASAPTVYGEFLRRGWPRRSRGWRPPTASPRWAAVTELPAARPPDMAERDWHVLLARRAGRSQAAIAAELGVSSQRVAQLEARGLARLARQTSADDR